MRFPNGGCPSGRCSEVRAQDAQRVRLGNRRRKTRLACGHNVGVMGAFGKGAVGFQSTFLSRTRRNRRAAPDLGPKAVLRKVQWTFRGRRDA